VRHAAALCLWLAVPALAGPLDPKEVPPPLKPWIPWALHGVERRACPRTGGEATATTCDWTARLHLEASAKGGTFRQDVELFAPDFVRLPGDPIHWPLDVRDQRGAVPVVARADGPEAYLPAGVHALTGRFVWDSPPAALGVPPSAALLELVLDGRRVAQPELDDEGRLFLRRSDREAGEAAKLEIRVQRKLTDGMPLLLTTQLVLDVAGKAREVLLGRALPDGFVPLQLDSPLAARIESDGHLRVQVRPGKWTLTLVARRETPLQTLSRPAADGPWTEGDETWVFEPAPALRVVTLEGLSAVDPTQTQLPPEWRNLAAFAVRPGDSLRLVEQRRGNAEPDPDQLALHRELWLDLDGRGWTFLDRIAGPLTRSWRLEMPAPAALGRAAVNGRDQPLTRLAAGAPPGLEVRQGLLDLNADARLESGGGRLPAVAWAHDFTSVAATLHLPPGWRLFGASGVDDVPGTWVQHWSLLDLFLVLVLALATAKLHGWRVGVLALFTLVLTFPESDAPRWTWVAVLAVEALLRVVPEGRLRTVLRGARLAAFALLAIVLVGFALDHLRENLYPVLAGPDLGPARIGLPGTAAPAARPPVSEAESVAEEGRVAGEAEPKEQPEQVAEKAASPSPANRDELVRREAPSPGTVATPSAAPVRTSSITEFDRQAVVQTGPGIPRWHWRDIPLRWSGPVQRTQELRLWLLSPGENRFLAFLRVLLLAWLALRLFTGSGIWTLPRLWRPRKAAVAAAGCLLLAVPVRAEEQPTDQRLEQLREKLLEAPTCAPACASAGRAILEVEPTSLRLRVELQSAAPRVAVPLAGGGDGWRPEQVILDGRPTAALRRIDGTPWAVLPRGVHILVLSGAMPARETVQLPLGLQPRHLEVHARGWKVDGVREDGRPEATLQLTRTERAGGGEALRPGALPPFARVQRTLHLGLTWEVETQVSRLSPPGSAVVLEVPLVPGESVLTSDIQVAQGKVPVNLAPGVDSFIWRSTLEQRPELALTAATSVPWVESWSLDAGPMWHVELSGIPPVHAGGPGGAHLPEWRPWPGESVRIQLARPEGLGGRTLTLDQAALDVRPGLRSTEASLSIVLRASRGGQHAIRLPAGIELLGVSVNGRPQPARLEGGELLLPLAPPFTRIEARWREPRGIQAFFRPSAVDLGVPGTNVDVTVRLPAQRWVLWVGGPAFGPALLFWSALLVTVLVALGLARIPHAPLGRWAWILLGVGLTQVSVPAAALVVVWLVALGWRGAVGARVQRWWLFDVMQLVLVVATVAGLVVLFRAVEQGLLGQPDMQIAGNGSTAAVLRWTQDRVARALPTPLVVSLPLLVYRLAMLAWALWLATALLGWFRRGWGAFGTGGLWRPRPPVVTVTAPERPPG
jgi:hypothetical protein